MMKYGILGNLELLERFLKDEMGSDRNSALRLIHPLEEARYRKS